jgi:2-polyprenyl-6-hydroxyphenyl methylase/3-demethylubiquinone-9 3-methyltransferase
MPIGLTVRRLLGPLEASVGRLYRDLFFDVRSFADALRSWIDARSILEIGCGDGLVTEELRRAFPGAEITGIDVRQRIGTLFRGDRTGITFLSGDLASFARRNRSRFDLAVISDVLHHVEPQARPDLLRSAAAALRGGGGLALKEWERRLNLPHLFAWFSDRFITGDRVRFETAETWRALTGAVLEGNVEREVRFPPWRNNVGLFIRRSG